MTEEPVGGEAIAWIRERDVDILLASELHGQPAFASWLFETAGAGAAVLENARVSVSQENGESDLVVTGIRPDAAKAVLLIENKIAAAFQPQQDIRYAVRADRLRADGQYAAVRTVLLAPETYLASADVGFEVALSYESLAAWLDQFGDARSKFFVRTLRVGIDAQRRGYVAVPDPANTRFWDDYYQLVARDFSALRMSRPGARPAGSTFIYFRDALGRPVAGRHADIVHKFAHGWVDLQFAKTSAIDLEWARSRLPPGCEIARAAQSASVRRVVPKLDPQRALSAQEAELREALIAALELRAWALAVGVDQP